MLLKLIYDEKEAVAFNNATAGKTFSAIEHRRFASEFDSNLTF